MKRIPLSAERAKKIADARKKVVDPVLDYLSERDRQAYYDQKVEKHTKTATLFIGVTIVVLAIMAGYFLISG